MFGALAGLAGRIAPRLFAAAPAAEAAAVRGAATTITSNGTRVVVGRAATVGTAGAGAGAGVAVGTGGRVAAGAAAGTGAATSAGGMLAAGSTVMKVGSLALTAVKWLSMAGLVLGVVGWVGGKIFGGSNKQQPQQAAMEASGAPVDRPLAYYESTPQRAPAGHSSWADYTQNRAPVQGMAQNR